MKKWKVRRTPRFGDWEVLTPDGHNDAYFLEWDEAFYHAQKRVTVDPDGETKIGGSGLESLWVRARNGAVSIYYGGWGDLIIEDALIEPLGKALIAIAKHKEKAGQETQ